MARFRYTAPFIGKRKGFKLSFTGPTAEKAIGAAKTWLESNPYKGRRINQPERMRDGQWRVLVD